MTTCSSICSRLSHGVRIETFANLDLFIFCMAMWRLAPFFCVVYRETIFVSCDYVLLSNRFAVHPHADGTDEKLWCADHG
jgi:hypothetical protein